MAILITMHHIVWMMDSRQQVEETPCMKDVRASDSGTLRVTIAPGSSMGKLCGVADDCINMKLSVLLKIKF